MEIQAASGTTEAVLVRDEGGRRLPGVLFLTDIGGIRAASRKMARRMAELGYTVLVPNVFYRTSRVPVWDWKPNMEEEKSKRRFVELTSPLDGEAMERDGAAYVDLLAAHPAVSGNQLAVVGYCCTGPMALRTAAARPDRVAFAASFHGGGLWTESPGSPHRVLPRVKARLYFAHAVEDRSMPAEAIAELDSALGAWGGSFESEVYEGAHHSWTQEDKAAYNPAQAERAFSKLADLLAANL